ncbi:MAG: Ig-like domain-containing protein, partial [Gemmatimonadaceae bacterium]
MQPPVTVVQNRTVVLQTTLHWSPTWKSMDTTVFKVNQSGTAKGRRVGSALAVATNNLGKKDSVLVVVDPAVATSIALVIPQTNLTVAQITQASAKAKDVLGLTILGAPIAWATSDPSHAIVSSTGIITGVGAGTATITASSGAASTGGTVTVSGSPPPAASVTVSMSSTSLNVGQSLQASAVAKDAQGAIIPGALFTWSVSSSTIIGVSASGMVSAIAVGSAQVTASTFGAVGSLTVTVNPPPTQLVAPAALPRVYLNFPYTPATGNTIVVQAGGNLQNAIDSARRGDEIVLPAGASFTGNFTLPVKPGTVANGWITIRTDKLSQLPPEGTRVTPANASVMPKIYTNNSAPAIATMLGASGYRVVGVEVSVPASYSGPQYALVRLGDGSSVQNTLALVATDLVLDRVYVHGQTMTDLTRCVSLNSARTQITDSYLSECHGKNGIDSQAIQGSNGPGPYKIVNNTLIAATENIAFGGGDPWITGMIPSDIEIRRNYLYTPASWKGKWLKKNLFELKAGQRILIEGNVLDGSWTDGQTGWAFMLKTENQSGGC